MLLRRLRIFVFLTLLLPAGFYAWHWQSMPHASEYHDDGIYFVSAKAMAERNTFSIESLPRDPAQTKYPPLWPAVLSIAWRIEPHYPENLPIAILFCWIWLPLTLFTYRRWLQSAGLSPNAVLLLGGAWALNPYVVLFSTAMLSELAFLFFLLSALLFLHRNRARWAMIAGILAGAAFLTRTAGLALLPAAIIWFSMRGRWRNLGFFAAGMLPFIAGWTLWAMEHQTSGTDEVTLYYTNYFGHYLANFQWQEVHVYVWKNIDGLLHGLGSLILPDTTQSLLDKVLAESLAIAGIVGISRIVRQDRTSILVPFAAFAAVYGLMLVVWHFPPTERLVLPIVPLWLVGLYLEMHRLAGNIAQVFRKPETSQKVAGGVIAGLLALLFVFCGLRQWELLTQGLPRFYNEHAVRLADSEPAMAWIVRTLPPEARVLSENDPLLYLRTGRRGVGLEVVLPTIDWYREDHAARTARHVAALDMAQTQKLDYFLLNDWDYARDMPAEEHVKLIQKLKQDPRLEKLFTAGPTSVFRFR